MWSLACLVERERDLQLGTVGTGHLEYRPRPLLDHGEGGGHDRGHDALRSDEDRLRESPLTDRRRRDGIGPFARLGRVGACVLLAVPSLPGRLTCGEPPDTLG